MIWINLVTFGGIGLIVGFLIGRLLTKQDKSKNALKSELEKSRYDLEQYRQEMTDHFAHTAKLLSNLSKDYSKLYEHMAETSSELIPNLPEQDNPFSPTLTSSIQIPKLNLDTAHNKREKRDPQPKDYADSGNEQQH